MNCIIYLVRSSEKDVEEFNKSLGLLEENLLKYTAADVLVFVEESFEKYRSKVETNLELLYQTIESFQHLTFLFSACSSRFGIFFSNTSKAGL